MSKFQITVLGLLAAIACAVCALIGATSLILINRTASIEDVAVVESAPPGQEPSALLTPVPIDSRIVPPTATSLSQIVLPEKPASTPIATRVVPSIGTPTPVPPAFTPVPPTSTPAPISTSTSTAVSSLQKAYVPNVVDGDTIDVLIDGSEHRVRYILIDAPEANSGTYGEAATKANRRLVLGKVVTLERDVSETDRYGRLLRYVYVDGKMVNEELVKVGLAQVSTYPPDLKHFFRIREAQEEAQITGVGIWGVQAAATLAPGRGIIVDENSPNRPIHSVPTPTRRTNGGVTGTGCNCSYNEYNCPEFSDHSEAQDCYEYCKSRGQGDVHRLDADNDGIACEDPR